MWLTPWAAKAAPDDRQLLAATPDSNPTTTHHDSITARLGRHFSSPRRFSQRLHVVHGWVRYNLECATQLTTLRFNGWIARKLPKRTAESHIVTRWSK